MTKTGVSLPAISPVKASSSDGGQQETPQKLLITAESNPDHQAAGDSLELTLTSESMKKKRKEKKKDDLEPHEDRPLDYEFWTRCMDINNSIYYYNTHTGESTWLPPCSICYKHSDKWCQDCGTAFCDKHFAKKHNNTMSTDLVRVEDLQALKTSRHRWSAREMPSRKEIQTYNDVEIVKCIECCMKRATKMCLECWDPYCVQCFEIVHHVGALKLHAHGLYDEVTKGWYCVRTGRQGEEEEEEEMGGDEVVVANSSSQSKHSSKKKPDRYYIHGGSKESTYEKPLDLMSPLERTLWKNWQSHQQAAEQYVVQIEDLQFELEKVKYERDQLMIEKMHYMNKSKDEDDLQPIDRKAKGKAGEDPYMAKLMNPSNRKRGEARSNYIQSLLEAPLPTKPNK